MDLEKMSLKEIYEKYGLTATFDQEVLRRYKDRWKAGFCFKLGEFKEIFGSEMKAIDYLLKVLNINFYKLSFDLDYIPTEAIDKYLSKVYILDKRFILKKLDYQFVLDYLLIKEHIKEVEQYIDLDFIPENVVNDFLLNKKIVKNTAIKFLRKALYCRVIPLEVCEKYLSIGYKWLNDSRLISYVDTNFLLDALFIKKQLRNRYYDEKPNIDNASLNKFLLANDVEPELVQKFLEIFYDTNYRLTEEVVKKYFGDYKNWLNTELSEKVDINYLLKILLIDKQIINYPDIGFYLYGNNSKIINDFILNNDIDQNVLQAFIMAPKIKWEISKEVCNKYLTKDYSWLGNYAIVEKISPEFLLKALLIDKQINNYPEAGSSIPKEEVSNFFLTNDIDYDLFIKFMSEYEDLYYIMPREICEKYLSQNSDWLQVKNIVRHTEPEFLLKVLLIDKKIKDFPNYPSYIFKTNDKMIDEFLLKNDIDINTVLSFLNNTICNYISNNVYDKYLAPTTEWLKYDRLLRKLGYDYVNKYFTNNQDMILANWEYKKGLLEFMKSHKYKDQIPKIIIEDSLVKKEYDFIIEVLKTDYYLKWLIPEGKEINTEEEKLKIVSIFKEYLNLQYNKDDFEDFVANNYEVITATNIKYLINLIHRIGLSNSSELRRVSYDIIKMIINSPNSYGKLERIENLFLKNNIPFVGKAYSVFDIIYPDKTKVGKEGRLSPVLQEWQGYYREVIIFADLIKASFGSNNRSVRDYLQNIEKGNILFNKISKGEVSYENLSNEEKIVIDTFCNHLITLYERTKKGKKEELDFHKEPVETLQILKEKFAFNGQIDYDLQDRIVKMFCHFAGIDTLNDAKAYLKTKVQRADARNRERAKFPLEFKKGDFVKGIGDIEYLGNILQNGSVAKEFLGGNAYSDHTPLDTDVCMLPKANTIGEAIKKTATIDYGPIYFVLKNDNRFVLTRDSKGNIYKGNPNKLEAFYTGVIGSEHYGIRTGFASSEIDYIVINKYDERLGLEIAINGFYIPVCDFNGKIIFTPKDYDELRSKMQGLTHLGNNSFKLSPYLNIPGVNELIMQKQNLRQKEQENLQNINEVIKEAVEKANLKLKIGYDGNLEEGVVELLNTGSTARETNIPHHADYDYIIRIDTNIIKDDNKLEEFLDILEEAVPADKVKVDASKLRFLGIKLANGAKIDLDLSYMAKLDKLEYSTEVALEDRLKTIKEINPQGYDYVIANILLAKKVLKDNGVYKPRYSPECQNGLGGLGGVGIENWILQNNGSFFEALNSFLQVAQESDFETFQKKYFVWDFGENHYALKDNDESSRYHYPHDNFISRNLNEAGYNQMKKVLLSCQDQYVTSLLENLYENYLNNNITLEIYVANLEKLAKEVGNTKVRAKIDKYFAFAGLNPSEQKKK